MTQGVGLLQLRGSPFFYALWRAAKGGEDVGRVSLASFRSESSGE